MLSLVKDISIAVGGVIALITFVTGTIQYIMQGRHQRAAQFIEMRRRFLDNPSFREILNLLDGDSPRLAETSVQDRRNLVGFLEEIALLVESRLLRADVAFYMFGYYVSLIGRSTHFWTGLDREGSYWRVFREFEGRLAKLHPGNTELPGSI